MNIKKNCIKLQQPPCTGGPKLVHSPIGTHGKRQKMKMLILFWLWSKCVPMNLKRTSMIFKIKLTDNLVPLATTFSLRSILFVLNWVFCVCVWLYRVRQTHIFPIKMAWLVLFSLLEHVYTTIKIKFKFLNFWIFYRSLWGHAKFFRGVPVNWYQKYYHLWHYTIILHILKVGK